MLPEKEFWCNLAFVTRFDDFVIICYLLQIRNTDDGEIASMDGMITKSAEISSQDHGGFSGYASTFYTLDSHGDIIDPSAYTHDLPRFLSKGFVGGSNHDHKKPIGGLTDA